MESLETQSSAASPATSFPLNGIMPNLEKGSDVPLSFQYSPNGRRDVLPSSMLCSMSTRSATQAAKRPKLSLKTTLRPPKPPIMTAQRIQDVSMKQETNHADLFADAGSCATSSTLRSEFPWIWPSSLIRNQKRLRPSVDTLALVPIPYRLTLGPRSILRNSPLPKRAFSCTTSTNPRKLFNAAKRVTFTNKSAEFLPVQILEDTDEDTGETAHSRSKSDSETPFSATKRSWDCSLSRENYPIRTSELTQEALSSQQKRDENLTIEDVDFSKNGEERSWLNDEDVNDELASDVQEGFLSLNEE